MVEGIVYWAQAALVEVMRTSTRRRSVIALANMGLTKTRVRAISRESNTPLEKAIQRQEQRKTNQEPDKSNELHSMEKKITTTNDESIVPVTVVESLVDGLRAKSRRDSVRTISPIFDVDDEEDGHVVL